MSSALDRQSYLAVLTGAVTQAPRIDGIICDWLAQGAENLVFSGAGGAAILCQPAAQLLQQHGSLPVYCANAAELALGSHRALGAKSIVVIPSVSGTTRESVALLHRCKSLGAKVLSLVGRADTPLATEANASCLNDTDDTNACENFYIQTLSLALAVLRQRGEGAELAPVARELPLLPQLLLAVKDQFETGPMARGIAGAPWHLITAAGNCWAQAQYFSMCVLEEQQRIGTRPVHAADFFHGVFELVEHGTSIIVLKGEDASRPLAERVESFALRFAGGVLTLDAASFDLPGLSPATRAAVSPAVLASALHALAVELARLRHHPLDTRRYYNRVQY